MTFVHADQIARAHGYVSRLLLPGESYLSMTVERPYTLFNSRKNAGVTHCLAYSDLTTMDEQTLCATLAKSSATAMDVPQH